MECASVGMTCVSHLLSTKYFFRKLKNTVPEITFVSEQLKVTESFFYLGGSVRASGDVSDAIN